MNQNTPQTPNPPDITEIAQTLIDAACQLEPDFLPFDALTDLDHPNTPDLLRTILKSLNIEQIAHIRMTNEICPIHLIDEEICLDDLETTECAYARQIRPHRA